MNGVITIANVNIYVSSLLLVFGFLIFGFTVYKKGLEYHFSEDSLFDMTILGTMFSLVFGRFVFVLANLAVFRENWLRLILFGSYPGINLFGMVLGMVLAVLLVSKIAELNIYQSLDLAGLGLPVLILMVVLGKFIYLTEMEGVLLPFWIARIVWLVFSFLFLWHMEGEYRTLEWYRNRKTQASPGFIFAVFMIVYGVEEIVNVMIIGRTAIVLGVALLIGGLIFLFSRAGRINIRMPRRLIKKGGRV